jgi:hypothetical protein
VEGTITQKGKPASQVLVIFYSEANMLGPQSSGVTDEQGHYRLSKGDKEGAPTGQHRVCFIDRSSSSQSRTATARVSQKSPRIPREYASPETTPRRAEVHPGPQTIDFDLP